MAAFSSEMMNKPRLVVMSKQDIFQNDHEELPTELSGEKVLSISSITGEGLDILMAELAEMMHE